MAGKKQLQHLRAARLAKRLKTEAKGEEEYLPEELIARVDVSEEQSSLTVIVGEYYLKLLTQSPPPQLTVTFTIAIE